MKDIMSEIIGDMEDVDKGTRPDLPGSTRLSEDNFHEIVKKRARVAYIDGGNNELISSAHLALHLVRVCAVIGDEMIREEYFCLAKGDGEKYGVKLYAVNGNGIGLPEFDAYDKDMAVGRHRLSPSRVCEQVRKLLEVDLAKRMCRKADIIVRDGDLAAKNAYEKGCYEELFEEAKGRGTIICGLSKSSTLLTDTGYSLVSAIGDMGPTGSWYYHPLDEKGEMHLVKLHPKSQFIFRADIRNGSSDVFGALAVDSSDPVFLGYPYGLIKADRHARVSDEEMKAYRMRFAILAGKELGELDAHLVLDNIS